MCSMRKRRNKFSLIGRLPPEILCRIFSFHAINQPVTRDPAHKKSPSGRTQIGWITITHVCNHWRQVALSEPDLWRAIDFHLGAELAEEMLARSKYALITYCRNLSFCPMLCKSTIDNHDEMNLRGHLSHIQRLVLYGTTDSLAPAVRVLTMPAPHLESLELRGSCFPGDWLYIALPSNIFAYQAPKLRHVTLNWCSVPWDSWFFHDLTYLEICPPAPISNSQSNDMEQVVDRHHWAVGAPSPSLDQLLSILEGMPSLEVLILGYCLPRPDSLSHVVPLPHMSRLSLEGSLSECVAILEHVSVPGSASLSLSGSARGSPDGLLSTLISLVAAHFRAAGTPVSPLSTLRVCDGLFLTAWDIDVSSNLPVFAPSAPLRLYLCFFDIELTHSFPLQVCRAFPLRDLRTFSMTRGGPIEWVPTEWADVSDHCPKVAHLQAGIDWVPVLECALTERTFFPNLVTLTLVGVDFLSLGHPSDGQSQPLCALLCAWLHARRDAGIPIRCLRILQCRIKFRSLASLRALVQAVEWHSSERVFSDSDYYRASPALGSDSDSDSDSDW